MPLAGLTVNMLDQLMNRGLVERRYVLTREGRELLERQARDAA